jgi:hypothetical protein
LPFIQPFTIYRLPLQAFLMKNLILFDNETRDHLLPFTFTRPVCEIGMGGMTNRERWEKWMNGSASYITQDYLSERYDITISEVNYLINGSVLPTHELVSLISQMENGGAMLLDGELVGSPRPGPVQSAHVR